MAGQETRNTRQSHKAKQQPALNDISMQFGKIPPQNLEAEEAVLGAIMSEKKAITKVLPIIPDPESFYKQAHADIFEACLSLYQQSLPIDLLTVTQELRKTAKLDFVGGPFYLVELTQRVGSAANIEPHAYIVKENYIKREIIKISGNLTREGFDYTTDAIDLLNVAVSQLFAIQNGLQKRKYRSSRDAVVENMAHIADRMNHDDNALTGVPSGFTQLDRITNGWQKTDLVILAARPGMGKTAILLSAIRNAAVDFKIPVGVFSLEMSTQQLIQRLQSGESEIPLEKLQKKITPAEMLHLQNSCTALLEAPIYIDDTPALTIIELRAKAMQMVEEQGVQLIVIDYLQLMRGTTKSNNGNREQEIAEISRGLKALAKELNVPVIALSQLSRATETRGGDKRPQLSDLRESGSIEQDADMVLFLYRAEYYKITEDVDGTDLRGIGELIIAKHRNGILDNVRLRFLGQFTKFVNLEQVPQYSRQTLATVSKEELQELEKKQAEMKRDSTWNKFPTQSTQSTLGSSLLDSINKDETPF